MTPSDKILVEFSDGVARITLNRPSVANAIDCDLVTALHRALDEVSAASHAARCVILTGAGTSFCSGVDLHAIDTSDKLAHESTQIVARHHLDRLMCRFVDFRLPIIAAVNGPAVGAGMTLALSADIIVMSERAYFLPSFTRLGFVPDQGITHLLARYVGAGRTRALLLLADRIDAQTAYEWGIAYRIASEGELEACVAGIARQLAAGPSTALSLTRQLLAGAEREALSARIASERRAQQTALHSPECVEGVKAFFAKRPPRFDEARRP